MQGRLVNERDNAKRSQLKERGEGKGKGRLLLLLEADWWAIVGCTSWLSYRALERILGLGRRTKTDAIILIDRCFSVA